MNTRPTVAEIEFQLKWVEVGNDLVAELEVGKVVISPNEAEDSVNRPYTVEHIARSGDVVLRGSFDLYGCKEWAKANLPLLDQVTGRFDNCGNVLETLEMCQKLISQETDAIHWLRIEYIKKFMADRTEQPYQIVEIPYTEQKEYELTWLENGRISYAETRHGRVEVEEVRKENRFLVGGASIRHDARIIHHTEVVLDCGTYVDFMDAEWALKECLTKLDDPHIYETLLHNMQFTLEICHRLLPENTDPIHYARLGVLGMTIFLMLD